MTASREPINLKDHHCPFPWCTGTIWKDSHLSDYRETRTSGRRYDLIDGLAVTVVVVYDESEDPRPRILLHFYADNAHVDVDVSPTAGEARRIAINLLEAADALDGWAGR